MHTDPTTPTPLPQEDEAIIGTCACCGRTIVQGTGFIYDAKRALPFCSKRCANGSPKPKREG